MRRYVVAGLLVWVPIGVTFLVVKFLVDLMDRTLVLFPAKYQPENLIGVSMLGVALTVLVVLATGIVVANLLGSRLVRAWEDLLARIPLVRSIYSAAKQITETVFSALGKSFRKVVLLAYPRRELWTLAFVTGDPFQDFERVIDRELVNVYVPTTPNPTSGFFIMVPKQDVIELDIPVELGLKMILSTGVVVPDQTPDAEEVETPAAGPVRTAPANS